MTSRNTRRRPQGPAGMSRSLPRVATELQREDVPPEMLALARRLQAALDEQHRPAAGEATRHAVRRRT